MIDRKCLNLLWMCAQCKDMQKKRSTTGVPVAHVRTELLNLRVSPAEKKLAKGLAERQGISVAMLVRQLIRQADAADQAA